MIKIKNEYKLSDLTIIGRILLFIAWPLISALVLLAVFFILCLSWFVILIGKD